MEIDQVNFPSIRFSRPKKIILQVPVAKTALKASFSHKKKLLIQTPKRDTYKKKIYSRQTPTPSLDPHRPLLPRVEMRETFMEQGLFSLDFLENEMRHTRSFFDSGKERGSSRYNKGKSLEIKKIKDFRLWKSKVPSKLNKKNKSPWTYQTRNIIT